MRGQVLGPDQPEGALIRSAIQPIDQSGGFSANSFP
jgi:hypothetical protein